jgi:predicted XRE-type DNA-binding protein
MSGVGYVIPVDPSELASRFSGEYGEQPDFRLDELTVEAYEFEEESLLPEGYEARVESLLDRIPEREADLIYLYYILKKRQADIAAIFEVTQAAISYRLDRGLQRIKFLLSIPEVSEEDLRRDLPEVLPQTIDVNILVGMWQTTCQSEVASKLGLTQGRVRHRFFKAVKVIEDAAVQNVKYDPYRKIFSTIASKKFNILREVKLPQWANRGGDALA